MIKPHFQDPSMGDDWQEAAFSNRHIHNRGKGRKSGKANSHGFNVKKTFGSYEIKSPKFPSKPGEAARLEVYTLNEKGDALVGELFVPGCLSANVLMAGSRKIMKRVVRDLEREEEEEKAGEVEEGKGDEEETRSEDGSREETTQPDEENDEEEEEDQKESRQAQKFEKNSFRSPKFWLKWQGHLLADEAESAGQVLIDDGYIVFSGNSCDKFDGTLSCEKLGWKNVKVSGWKIKGMNARDFEIGWISTTKEGEK